MSWDPIPAPRSLAPSSFDAWDRLRSEAMSAVPPAMAALIRERIAVLFAGAQADPAVTTSDTDRACAEAAEQFIIDVAAMSDAQRDAVGSALRAGTYPFFQTVYVHDLGFRLRMALEQLFEEPAADPASGSPAPRASQEPVDLWPALDTFLTVVAALDHLDPVTTELIRLRGARAHNCRICQSRRNVTAVTRGADESTFDKIDFYESSDLDERHKVALRLTDAVIWQPAAYPPTLVKQVRDTFTPQETIEIVLDVVRNAANKVAVALQADQAVVSVGVEYFSVASDGRLAYGLQAPVTAAAGS